MKKIIAVLLCLIVCVSMAVPVTAASSSDKETLAAMAPYITVTTSLDDYNLSVQEKWTLDYLWQIESSASGGRYELFSENRTITITAVSPTLIHTINEDGTSTTTLQGGTKEIEIDVVWAEKTSEGKYSERASIGYEPIKAGESITLSVKSDIDLFVEDGADPSQDLFLLVMTIHMVENLDYSMVLTYAFKYDNEAVNKVVAKGVDGNPFVDVKQSDYFYAPVVWALRNNITKGTTKTTFSPTATCTRGQVATFLWRAKGCPEPTTTENPFKDVKESDYYYKAILWAYENGITKGTSKTTFDPAGTCTSAHVVTFLWRANGKPAAEHTGTEYYAEAVAWANANGLLAGTDMAFAPDNLSPRADIVTYLYRDAIK